MCAGSGFLAQALVPALMIAALFALMLAPTVAAADPPSITIVSPAEGGTVTTNDIKVTITHSGFDNACKYVGLPDKDGQAHVHAMIDGMTMATLSNFYCNTDTFPISGVGLEPGEHTLVVDVATNTHADMMDTAKEVKFTYQPDTAQPAPDAVTVSGTPTAHLSGIEDGATTGPKFNLDLSADNFNASCDLEGKANIQGYGHYHVFVDMPMMDMSSGSAAASPASGEMMMSMAGMIGMPCGSMPVNLSAWPSGEHTLTVELVQDDHSPLEGAVAASVHFTLNNPDVPASVSQTMPNTGVADSAFSATTLGMLAVVALAIGLVASGWLLRRRAAR